MTTGVTPLLRHLSFPSDWSLHERASVQCFQRWLLCAILGGQRNNLMCDRCGLQPELRVRKVGGCRELDDVFFACRLYIRMQCLPLLSPRAYQDVWNSQSCVRSHYDLKSTKFIDEEHTSLFRSRVPGLLGLLGWTFGCICHTY
jgi:hypothetical protein